MVKNALLKERTSDVEGEQTEGKPQKRVSKPRAKTGIDSQRKTTEPPQKRRSGSSFSSSAQIESEASTTTRPKLSSRTEKVSKNHAQSSSSKKTSAAESAPKNAASKPIPISEAAQESHPRTFPVQKGIISEPRVEERLTVEEKQLWQNLQDELQKCQEGIKGLGNPLQPVFENQLKKLVAETAQQLDAGSVGATTSLESLKKNIIKFKKNLTVAQKNLVSIGEFDDLLKKVNEIYQGRHADLQKIREDKDLFVRVEDEVLLLEGKLQKEKDRIDEQKNIIEGLKQEQQRHNLDRELPTIDESILKKAENEFAGITRKIQAQGREIFALKLRNKEQRKIHPAYQGNLKDFIEKSRAKKINNDQIQSLIKKLEALSEQPVKWIARSEKKLEVVQYNKSLESLGNKIGNAIKIISISNFDEAIKEPKVQQAFELLLKSIETSLDSVVFKESAKSMDSETFITFNRRHEDIPKKYQAVKIVVEGHLEAVKKKLKKQRC